MAGRVDNHSLNRKRKIQQTCLTSPTATFIPARSPCRALYTTSSEPNNYHPHPHFQSPPQQSPLLHSRVVSLSPNRERQRRSLSTNKSRSSPIRSRGCSSHARTRSSACVSCVPCVGSSPTASPKKSFLSNSAETEVSMLSPRSPASCSSSSSCSSTSCSPMCEANSPSPRMLMLPATPGHITPPPAGNDRLPITPGHTTPPHVPMSGLTNSAYAMRYPPPSPAPKKKRSLSDISVPMSMSPCTVRTPQYRGRPRSEVEVDENTPSPQVSPLPTSEFIIPPAHENKLLHPSMRRSADAIPSDTFGIRDSFRENFETLPPLAPEMTLGDQCDTGLVCQRHTGVKYVLKKSRRPLRRDHSPNSWLYDYNLPVFSEAQFLAVIEHKNIVRYHNSWVERDFLYLQLEYCELGCLKLHRYPETTLLSILRQISSALKFLAQMDPPVVHLDVKPSNILSCQRRNRIVYKLADFGVAQVACRTQDGSDCIGSGYYQAPEILKHGIINPCADVFSLGISIFQLALTDRKDLALAELKHSDPEKELSSCNLSPFLLQILHEMKRGHKKRPTAENIVKELKKIRSQQSTSS